MPRPSPRHDGRVDVAIVGAGVTGCAAALRLAEAGLRVRVHDERGVAEGASGRNGGFALRGGAARYDVARETYGAEQARGFWRWTEEALDRMEELAGDALRRPGSYRLAADEEERDEIRLEYEALREDGIAAEWLDDLPGAPGGPVPRRRSRTRATARSSRRASSAGSRRARPRRARRSASTTASRTSRRSTPTSVARRDRRLRARARPELADAIWPTRGQVIVSEPLDRVLYDRPHYARQGFDYWQQLPDGRVAARRLPRRLDPGRADRRRGDDADDPGVAREFLDELLGETPRSRTAGPGSSASRRTCSRSSARCRAARAVDRRRLLRPRQRPRLRLRRARRRRDPRRDSPQLELFDPARFV